MDLGKLLFHIKNISFINNFINKNRLIVRSYFEIKYSKRDPYLTTSNNREIEKLEITFNSIKGHNYKHILDIGCGEGYLIEKLLPIADMVTIIDISRLSINRARNRIGKRENIKFIREDILRFDTQERFDLIICSEVLFYLQVPDIISLANKIVKWLLPGGHLLLVHVYGANEDKGGIPLKAIGAKTIHPIFINRQELLTLRHEEHLFFALTLLERVPYANK